MSSFSIYRRTLVTFGAAAVLALSVGGVSVASADPIHCESLGFGNFDCINVYPSPAPPPPPSSQINCRLAHPEILEKYYRDEIEWYDVLAASVKNHTTAPPPPAAPGPEAYECARPAPLPKPATAHAPVPVPTAPPAPTYIPVPTPPPAPVLPAPAVSANDQYSTSNGVKTSNDIQTELLQAGYNGPFDVPSLLAAYQRTTNSPVRPI